MGPVLVRFLVRFLAVGALALSLGACEMPSLDDLFGPPRGEILPGKRIAILDLNRGLEADPTLADQPVRLSAPYVNRRWTQYGGNPSHAMYHLSLAENPRWTWSREVGAGSRSDRRLLSQPIVVDDVLYSMDALSTVTAFDAKDGKVLWRTNVESENEEDGYFGGGLAFDGGRIYVATGFAEVLALDAADGTIVWRVPVDAPMHAAPTVAGGRVFVITLENKTIALDAEDGRRLWDHTGIQETTALLGAASPAVSGSVVVAPYSSGEVVGLLAENGRVLWSDSLTSMRRIDPLADIAHIRAAPVIDRGLVFAISHSGRMVAIDARRGLRAWERDIGGVEMPWVGGDYVYVVTNDAQLVCLTRREGRIRWVTALPRYESPKNQEDPIQWAGPILASDRLIVAGSNAEALSISPYTGEILGKIDLAGPVSVAPVVAGDSLYIITYAGRLIAMR